ncbi:MAG: hypothetical protein ACI89X_002336 [Planctomycetota bacterium]|jgi:hypothetical protein
MGQAILVKVFCTLVMLATGVVLLVGWLFVIQVDLVSVAIVFSGSLLGRCVLEPRPSVDAQLGSAADGASRRS